MLTAIDLDGQLPGRDREINDMRANRMLASNSDIRTSLAQRAPDDPFCIRHVAAQLPRAFRCLTHCHAHLTRFAALTTLSSKEERV